ncbi:MAG: iron-containing alcohol dehydrogenase family protein [Lachnospiraceae bacterium]|nr:iron-containing alcohol dehydrogenase family protein [Candidatus Equihabitans merdae]
MKLENYEMHLPSYSIGGDCYKKIPGVCKDYGSKILVIGGEKGIRSAIDKIRAAIEGTDLHIIGIELFGKDCTYKTVEKLRSLSIYHEADMVFAIGGGKAVDTCKCLCIDDDKPIFTFPTIASNCAATTSVSIMYNEDGTFLKPHFFIRPAMHTFIDTDVIAQSPAIYMWAGIGDTYAKYYESTISSRDENLEHYTALGVNISQMCKDPVLKYGKKAYEDQLNGRSSYELEQVVLAIVVTTGLASIFLTRDFTPDYNSGLAHAIFYALTRYPVIEEKHYHGEVVGFGILFALLCDQDYEAFEQIYRFNESIGLPVKLEDVEITEDQFRQILPELPGMSDVRHYPYAVSVEMMEDAWKKLDAFAAGRSIN